MANTKTEPAHLSPATFDALMKKSSGCDRVIWTAGGIAERIGASADFVRDKLAKEPGSPVRLVGGRYCALESELLDFFRPG